MLLMKAQKQENKVQSNGITPCFIKPVLCPSCSNQVRRAPVSVDFAVTFNHEVSISRNHLQDVRGAQVLWEPFLIGGFHYA